MKINKFVGKIKQPIERKDVVTYINDVDHGLAACTVPAYKTATKVFANLTDDQLKSQAVRSLRDNIVKAFTSSEYKPKGAYKNHIVLIYQTAGQLKSQLTEISTVVESKFGRITQIDAVTYPMMNVMVYISLAALWQRYATRYLQFLYASETASTEERNGIIVGEPEKASTQWLDEMAGAFGQITALINVSDGKLAKTINNIPETLVNAAQHDVMAIVGKEKLSPIVSHVRDNFSIEWPFYSIARWIGNWQGKSYKEAVENKRMLELRMLDYKEALNDNSDVSLQRKIDALQSRIDDIDYDISERSEAYGV